MKRYIAAGVILIAFSCTNAEKTSKVASDSTVAVAQESATAEIELKDTKVQSIYDGYILLKNALVATEFEAAKTAAATLKISLEGYKGCENTALLAGKIAGAKDIAAQRKEFTSLSSDVIALFKHADLKKGAIYVQRCPMANDGDGGEWLASEKKIQNPYYGDEMMECGAVIDEIKTAAQ
ncbi:DUF3347 domain-containing protein [Pedobacter sp. GR22-6]|uniref:DUF3347 domain-containing protein n=1 Tax=Pedobacter sp. GR22-6 TaxID=3127957 RepID=UPI00307DB568